MDVWRWIDTGSADGLTQMATDLAIAEKASHHQKPTFRVYCWQPYCISLGYHQSETHIDKHKCRLEGIDIVRRPTGGRAVFHAQEVTYSVVIPQNTSCFSDQIHTIYHLIGRGLIKSLQKLGIQPKLQKGSLDFGKHYKKNISIGCFSATSRYEVMINNRKVIGSAQRHFNGAVLQHGSILTGDLHLMLPQYLSDLSSEEKEKMTKDLKMKTISLENYLERHVDYKEVTDALRRGMSESLSVLFEDSELTNVESEHIEICRSRGFILSRQEANESE